MNLNKLKVVFMVCMVAVLAVSVATAGSRNQIVVEVPHDFMIGEEVMSAGKYTFEQEGSFPPLITCRNGSGEGSSIMHVITTLSRDGMADQEAKLVFDKTAGKIELSEVWFAGEDGFLVCGTTAAHTHGIVAAGK